MRKLALLALISSPAYSHAIPFNDPAYLSINKDPVKAQAIKQYCTDKKLGLAACTGKFAGSGNLAAESVVRCEAEQLSKRLQLALPFNPAEILERAHKVQGFTIHENDVDDHAHGFTKEARTIGANRAFNERLTEINNENSSFKGTTSGTSGTEMKGGFDVGIPGALVVRFDFGGNNSKTITSPQISKAQIEDLKAAWLSGWNGPFRFGVDPDVVIGKNGKIITGGQPAPHKTEKDVKAKIEEKKGAENPPEHEDDRTKNIPDIESTHVGKMAGESSLDVTGIATPVIDDLALQSPMEKCVEEQVKLLTDEMGKKTFDPNASVEDKAEAERAKTLTEHGYCDEQIFGREACAAKKFKEDSVVAVTIQEERKEAAAQALIKFQQSGECDPYALGHEFCQKQIDKWLKIPNFNIESEINQPFSGGESWIFNPNFQDSSIKSEVKKSGDAPRVWN